MKILPATQFIEYMQKGGSTRPWIVLLMENGKETAYVVKLWNNKDYETQYPIVKEVLGNILAREFSLSTPDFALVDFSKDFINYALEDGQRAILKTKHKGLKFSTMLLDSAIVYAPSMHRNYLKEYDFANLFAFDTLIYNFDRGRTPEKPNVLIQNNEFILIDHELSMPFIDNGHGFLNGILTKLNEGEIDFNYQKQLSFPYLKSLRTSSKLNLFDEFEENLSRLNINTIEGALKELTSVGVPCGHSEKIIEYLYILKRESRLFCKSLLRCIN